MLGAGRVVAPTVIKAIDETASTKTAVNAVRQTLDRFQAPLISSAVASGIRTEVREDAPAENTGIQQMPQNIVDDLQTSIDSFQVPTVGGNIFSPNKTLSPQQMLSPTVLPNEDDREIAMRQQMGIAGLV